MKKVLCLILVLMLAMGAAMAEQTVLIGDVMEVVKCKEFITLREEPSTKAAELDRVPLGELVRVLGTYDEKFTRVLYGGQAGYVLTEYLGDLPRTAIAYGDVNVEEGSEEYYNVNLFLSNFTEQYFMSPAGYFRTDDATDGDLVQFAIEHIWFNRQDDLEWGDWGNGSYNVRLSDESIPAVCEKYFGRVPENLSPLYPDYFGGYYYWTETGGHVPGGFAQMRYIERVGANQYRVTFTVHGVYGDWDESVFAMTSEELYTQHPEYTGSYRPIGSAVFTAKDLSDRSTWKLDWICMDWDV